MKRPFNYHWWVAFGNLWLAVASCFGASPASEARAAYLDCEKVGAEYQRGVRYVTLYKFPPDERKEAAKVLSYSLNALSRSRVITAPFWISDTLARFSIINYAPQASEYHAWQSAWEQLGAKDTTFGIITEVLDPTTHKTIITRVDGGWLDASYQKLKAKTASNAPILPADWFIYHALTSPHYDAFVGIPETEAAFLKSIGIDTKTIEKLRANAGANLIISGVTGKPRRVVWTQGPLGGYYATLDVEQVDAERDPLRRPINADGATFKFDVTEGFAIAPNGLFRTVLFNAQGQRQDTVPDKVAKRDDGDGIIYNHHSCIVCHKEAGLRPFVDDQTRLTAKAPVQSYNPEYTNRILEFYDEPRLARQMAFDRATYTAAIAQATGGMKPEEFSAALGRCIAYYIDAPITCETAAREVGQTVDDFKRANVNSDDPHILNLIHDGETLRGSWESSFAAAMLAAGGAK